jgi:hypothetical protein
MRENSLIQDFTISGNNKLEFHYTTELEELINSAMAIWALVMGILVMFSSSTALAGSLYTALSLTD